MEDSTTSKKVADAVQQAIQNEALQEAVLKFGETRILFSKGRPLGEQLPQMDDPPEYPDVPTQLKDKKDSWLK
jgi:hypothetical protein